MKLILTIICGAYLLIKIGMFVFYKLWERHEIEIMRGWR